MHRDVILRSILDIGVVPVVRTSSAESAVRAIEAVYRGGIRAAEITMTVPGAIKALEKLGIVTINPVGEPFDPSRHEAMLAQPSNTAEPNSVLQVVQPGYELNGRLLRPARVIVSKAP